MRVLPVHPRLACLFLHSPTMKESIELLGKLQQLVPAADQEGLRPLISFVRVAAVEAGGDSLLAKASPAAPPHHPFSPPPHPATQSPTMAATPLPYMAPRTGCAYEEQACVYELFTLATLLPPTNPRHAHLYDDDCLEALAKDDPRLLLPRVPRKYSIEAHQAPPPTPEQLAVPATAPTLDDRLRRWNRRP